MPPFLFLTDLVRVLPFHFFAVVALALAWLVPNHYDPWVSVYNEACAGVALLLFALGNGRLALTRPAPLAAWLIAAVAFIPLLQWLWGQLAFSGDVVVSVLYLLGFASAVAVGHAAATGGAKSCAARLAIAALVASVVSCGFALYQALGLGELGIWMQAMPSGGRAFANLAQPNNLATLLGFGAVGLLVLREQGRCSRGFGLFMLGLLLVGLALSQSRTALLFGPVIALVLWQARRRGIAFTTRPALAWAAAAAHWLLAWSWAPLQAMWLLSPPMSLTERGVQSGRFQMWAMLLESLQRVPWRGYGWLQVGEAELAVVNQHAPVGELWLHGHNLFVDLLVWCGLLLGALLSVLILYWIVSRAQRVRTAEAAAGYMTVTVLLLHAMFELPHQYAYFLIPAGLWIGLIESDIDAPGLLPPIWNLLPQAVGIVLFACILKDYGAVEEDARLIRFEQQRIGDLHAAQPAPDAPFLSTLTESLRFMRTEPKAGMSAAELARASAIVKRYPYASALSRYADMLALNERLPEAIEVFKSIRQMNDVRAYASLRGGLRDRVARGQADLTALDQAVPP